MKKFFKIGFRTLIYLFSAIGFILVSAWGGLKLGLTNEPGMIDFNDRHFQNMADKHYSGKSSGESMAYIDSLYANVRTETDIYSIISAINEHYPYNADLMRKAYSSTNDPEVFYRMLDAFMLKAGNLPTVVNQIRAINKKNGSQAKDTASIYKWMNIDVWKDFKIALLKDRNIIDSVAKVTGVEPRMIVAVLLGEQIRMFTSNRDLYKRWLAPLKLLLIENRITYGVTGIMENTALRIETNLKDSLSEYYIGSKFSHMLDFPANIDVQAERLRRLRDDSHYYSYLYTALMLKQTIQKWKVNGVDISERPEILSTIFNIGFHKVVPNPNPKVGGSKIEIDGITYTFGSLSYEFYYSGEMVEYFPYCTTKI